jgi:hypothetical protein
MGFLNYFFKRKSNDEKIKYVVKGSSKSYNVTFKCSGDCDPVQKDNVPNGWSHSFVANPGDYFYLSAQSNSKNSNVDLRVYQNGRLYKKMDKAGDFPLVTASGLLT